MKSVVSQGDTQIGYYSRDRIDVSAWDQCIQNADNGLIYGYTYYLDSMADNWDALIFSDYKVVMPLPWRKKAGIYYLYPPFVTAELGAFGAGITRELVENFLKQIPRKFSYWDLPLNPANYFAIDEFPFYGRMNHTLSLNKPYEAIKTGYNDNTKRNIKKCKENNCRFTNNIDINSIIELNKSHDKNASFNDYENFKKLFWYLRDESLAKTYGVFSAAGEILSSAVFFYSHNRAYYILVGNTPAGKSLGASHALIDRFIEDHAGNDLILDFEGSDIPGLAAFYSGFGAQKEMYPAIRLNRLPWYLKWLKR